MDNRTPSIEESLWVMFITQLELMEAIARSNSLLTEWRKTCQGRDSIYLLCGRG